MPKACCCSARLLRSRIEYQSIGPVNDHPFQTL
jgi:hypothetical protein